LHLENEQIMQLKVELDVNEFSSQIKASFGQIYDVVHSLEESVRSLVDVFDTKSGKVMWQTDGSYIQNVAWSEDSRYLALAVTARVWCCITVIDTETWTAWEFALPDGSSLPNYWVLTEDADWCVWNGENNVNFTVDNNDGKNVSYSCDLTVKDGALSGIVKETK